MATASYAKRLVDETGLRRIAQALVVLVFVAPGLLWVVTDCYVLARSEGGDALPFSRYLFDFLATPFTSDFASLGFVATVVIPAAIGVVCYKYTARTATTPSSVSDELNNRGYVVVGACLVGIAISFVTIMILGANKAYVDALSATRSTSIYALATATFTFYALYLVQFLGFNPK